MYRRRVCCRAEKKKEEKKWKGLQQLGDGWHYKERFGTSEASAALLHTVVLNSSDTAWKQIGRQCQRVRGEHSLFSALWPLGAFSLYSQDETLLWPNGFLECEHNKH